MADEIKLKAPTVEQQVNVVINGEEKLKSFASTLEKMSSNKNLQKYFKDQKQLIEDVSTAYGNFTKNASKNNALELMKTTNALKALSDVDISSLIPDFKNFSQALENANKVAGNLDSAFSVSSFKDAFSSFETLRAYGIDIENFFKHFELDINVANLQESLRLAEQETRRVRRELSETQEELSSKKIELASFIDGSGLTEQIEKLKYLENEIRYVREQASEEFRTFLRGNDFSGWDLDENGAFERYFNEIREGTLTAKEAIANFKHEYSYLLQEKFAESGGLFNLQQVQEFENKLESVLTRVEEISRQMNDIIENGVMTKAVQNLSVDDSLSPSLRDLFANILKDEEALSSIAGVLRKIIDESVNLQNVNNKTFDEEQFNKLLILFEKIEHSLSSMKAVFVDVGDGEEFSPLLKTINSVQEAVSNIKFNVNMDLGSEVNERMNQKVSQSMNRQLEAYRNLFAAMKSTGKTNKEMLKFFEPDDASISEIIGAYKGIIDRANKQFGKDIYKSKIGKDAYNTYTKEIKNATDQFNRATNKKNTENPLGDLFGKNELVEVVSQLGLIADKLSEISKTVSGLGDVFKNTFKDGVNVSASVEEIEKLTSRVKELEDELSKIKPSTTTPVETNISSGNEILKVYEGIEDLGNEQYRLTTDIGLSHDKLIDKIKEETKAIEAGNAAFKERWTYLDAQGKVIDSYIGVQDEVRPGNVSGAYKVVHTHPSLEDYGGNFSIQDMFNYLMNELNKGVKQIELVWRDKIFNLDFSNMNEKSIENFVDQYAYLKQALMTHFNDESEGGIFRNLNEQLKNSEYTISIMQKLLSDLGGSFTSNTDLINIDDKELENILSLLKEIQGVNAKLTENTTPEQMAGLEKELLSIKRAYKERQDAIKDTFQGDKIKEATTSAKELDKTLEEVEISKEGFDDVIAKFNIIEEKAKNIVKITQSSVWNQAKNNYDTSYTVKYKDGSSEILGESSNPQKLRSKNVLYDAKQSEKEAKALERAAKQAQKLAEEKRKARQADKQATQSSVDKALKDQLNAWEEIQKIRLQIAQTDSKDTEKLHNLNEQKKSLQKQYIEAGKVLKANKDLYNQTEQQAKLDLERLETNEKINKLKLNNVDVGSVLSQGDSDLKKFEARKNQSEEYRGTVEKLKQSIEELRVLENSRVSSKLLSAEEVENINKAIASVKEYTEMIKNMPAVEKGSDENSRNKLTNRIYEYMKKNTRMSKEFREELENIIKILRTGGDSVNIKEMSNQFEDVKIRIKEAKQEGISFFDIFKNKAVYGFAARLAQYYLSFYDFIRYARYAVQSVIEFDTALTEMRKVSDESISTLERLQKATFDLADGVGTTALELQKSVADFMRVGETLEDATKSAQDANVLFRVSEFDDVTQATDALVAMSAAYKDLEKSQINDVLNEIGNNYAISTDELASALQKSAATLSVAGNNIYEAAALVTAGNTVLQDADSVGTGLKMISLRILGTQEAKDELASLGENVDDFVVQTKSKIDQTVRNYTAVASNSFNGISVLDDNGNYRSTYEILRDISLVYQEIIETDKKAGTNRGQALLEVLAGKNRSNVAASILQSPEILESAYESALNSAGSAQEELNKYLESAEAKVQELKNQLQEFWSVLLDSGTLKTIISNLTTLLEKATDFVDTFGALGTAGVGIGAYLGIKNAGREKCYPSY